MPVQHAVSPVMPYGENVVQGYSHFHTVGLWKPTDEVVHHMGPKVLPHPARSTLNTAPATGGSSFN
jgi:hypothetical protein